MTREDKIKAFTMRIDGYSYVEIAKELCYSVQNVEGEIKKIANKKIMYSKRCAYPNLLKEMKKKHYSSIREFCEKGNLNVRHFSAVFYGEKVKIREEEYEACTRLLKSSRKYLFAKE